MTADLEQLTISLTSEAREAYTLIGLMACCASTVDRIRKHKGEFHRWNPRIVAKDSFFSAATELLEPTGGGHTTADFLYAFRVALMHSSDVHVKYDGTLVITDGLNKVRECHREHLKPFLCKLSWWFPLETLREITGRWAPVLPYRRTIRDQRG